MEDAELNSPIMVTQVHFSDEQYLTPETILPAQQTNQPGENKNLHFNSVVCSGIFVVPTSYLYFSLVY